MLHRPSAATLLAGVALAFSLCASGASAKWRPSAAPGALSSASIPAGVCGDNHACPTRPRGRLALNVGRRAVTAELASEHLPITESVAGCLRVGRAEVECGVAVGPATYGPVGCAPGGACSPPQTIKSQFAQLFARRIAPDRVLVWYGPGKPAGINYIVAL